MSPQTIRRQSHYNGARLAVGTLTLFILATAVLAVVWLVAGEARLPLEAVTGRCAASILAALFGVAVHTVSNAVLDAADLRMLDHDARERSSKV